jgi:hypothetical protein
LISIKSGKSVTLNEFAGTAANPMLIKHGAAPEILFARTQSGTLKAAEGVNSALRRCLMKLNSREANASCSSLPHAGESGEVSGPHLDAHQLASPHQRHCKVLGMSKMIHLSPLARSPLARKTKDGRSESHWY